MIGKLKPRPIRRGPLAEIRRAGLYPTGELWHLVLVHESPGKDQRHMGIPKL